VTPPYGRRSGLLGIQLIFCSFVAAVFLFAFLLPFVITEPQSSPWVWAVLALSSGAVFEGARRLTERPLDCSTERALIDSWGRQFFVRVVCSEASALVGFVGAFVTGHWWVYVFGAVPTLIAFWRMAPTTANVQREGATLASSGCGLDLYAVLSRAPGPAR
jgi:hypothetical protein